MQIGNVFCCDHKECKSQVVLADSDDLKHQRTALAERGWEWKEHNGKKPDEHYCQVHVKTKKDED
jgi:hypothetical protein